MRESGLPIERSRTCTESTETDGWRDGAVHADAVSRTMVGIKIYLCDYLEPGKRDWSEGDRYHLRSGAERRHVGTSKGSEESLMGGRLLLQLIVSAILNAGSVWRRL